MTDWLTDINWHLIPNIHCVNYQFSACYFVFQCTASLVLPVYLKMTPSEGFKSSRSR